jgi:dienelactone hydrolase
MRRIAYATLFISLGLAFSAQAQDKVTFPSKDSDLTGGMATTIAGYLYKPEGTGPFPAIVGMHGCNGLVGEDGKVLPLYGAWAELLAKEGYLVLLPDSFVPRGYGDICAIQPLSVRPVKPDREVPRDTYGALSYLQTRPDVRADRIGILGLSYGASSMFYTIAEGARPKEISAAQDFRAAVAFYAPCQQFLTLEPKWKPRLKMLFLQGELDNFTPAAPCKALLTAVAASDAPPVESHWYPNVHHGFDHPNSPLRELTYIKLPPDGHHPTLGTNPEARADSILRVKAFLATNLR